MTAANPTNASAGDELPPSAPGRPGAPFVAELTRRDVWSGDDHVESAHTAHLVVAAPDGEVVASCGDVRHPTFVRSTAKPVQATACLEVLDAAGEPTVPSGAELAVAWSSHRGEAVHLAAVRRLLRRSGISPDDLTCPAVTAEADPGTAPTRLQHNCSGKHALFALAGARLGLAGAALLDPAGPLQRQVLATLQEVFGHPLAVGVDGCGAPAVAVPLSSLSSGMAKLVAEPRFARVRDAGLAHPDLVGGQGRLETALLAAGVVAKVGAEGVYGVGWVDAGGRPWGLAVKAVDGASRGVAAATIHLLTAIGAVAERTWSPPPPLGGGRPAGVIRATAEVDRVARVLVDSGVSAGSR